MGAIVIEEIIAKHHRHPWMVGTSHGLANFRALALEKAFDIESELIELLKREFKAMNREYDDANCDEDLFGEWGAIASLSKMAAIAHHLGFISRKDLQDLRKLYRVRNMYAHGRGRTHLKDEPSIFAHIEACHVYRDNKAAFDVIEKTYYHEGVYLSVCEFFVQRFRNADPCSGG